MTRTKADRSSSPGRDDVVRRRDVSPQRKAAYYVGNAITGLGFLLFFSIFVTSALSFGDFTDFGARGSSMGLRAVVGMAMMIGGRVVAHLGAAGAAGSGFVLDPQRASRDLEPFARQQGGMLKDTLDEAGIDVGKAFGGRDDDRKPVVMIRCRACGKLNEEDSKFCQECGGAL